MEGGWGTAQQAAFRAPAAPLWSKVPLPERASGTCCETPGPGEMWESQGAGCDKSRVSASDHSFWKSSLKCTAKGPVALVLINRYNWCSPLQKKLCMTCNLQRSGTVTTPSASDFASQSSHCMSRCKRKKTADLVNKDALHILKGDYFNLLLILQSFKSLVWNIAWQNVHLRHVNCSAFAWIEARELLKLKWFDRFWKSKFENLLFSNFCNLFLGQCLDL